MIRDGAVPPETRLTGGKKRVGFRMVFKTGFEDAFIDFGQVWGERDRAVAGCLVPGLTLFVDGDNVAVFPA